MSWLWVFVGFCFLIVIHEAGHFAAAKAVGMRVERFFLFFGPTIWSFKRGETEYGVKSIPLGGYVKITGMNPEEDVPPEHEENAYFRKPVWKRIVVVAAGPAVNIALAFVILFGVAYLNAEQATQSVREVLPATPAAGILKAGDRIIAVDGNRYRNVSSSERPNKFREEIASHKCSGHPKANCVATTAVKLTIERRGKMHLVSVWPRYSVTEKQVLVGFRFATHSIDVTAAEAADRAGGVIWRVVSGTVHVFTHLFEEEERDQVAGVVGISDVGHQAIEEGLEQALLLLALVSLSLGLINLLPTLPLDGGHIFWALAEKLRGRPVSVRTIERATIIGFAFFAVLIVVGLSNDIGRVTGEGFNVR